ncbi:MULTISPECIES: hypothetical protein [Variovorax]|jgi:hypothetical protein|uniref:DUF2782 domain-containing protein n=1 Tax=Variovorax ginsengisoli TaxID=363844 RepID=A0ABT8RYQ2_9BURK|nr:MULTISPECIES: hypothetical protein [Variovorax]MDM0070433.1 hypothetical protein [Variovorax sp. J31P207]MDN8612636.1 hypothetical protein [Variovorax ginsengisoli]MDO1531806.1 hypothetical protein [Variovorax ginsengisoli]
MSSSMPLVRLALLALACAAPAAVVFAQNPQPAAPAPAQAQPDPDKAAGRQNQTIERIHVEDSGATIDELRVGGQTQDIKVKPKNNAPAYQVLPNTEERSRSQGQSDSSAGEGGSRVWWNVFKF